MLKNERHFLHCKTCGNIVGMIENAGVKLHCCGSEMTEIKANTVDAAKEKHVPVANREGNVLTVNVGEVAHPMLKEHYITWIAIAQGNLTQRISLKPEDEPKASFLVSDGDITIYEYCNLHGLWASEFSN